MFTYSQKFTYIYGHKYNIPVSVLKPKQPSTEKKIIMSK